MDGRAANLFENGGGGPAAARGCRAVSAGLPRVLSVTVSAQLIVEGSLDGSAWTRLATASTEAGAAAYLGIALPGVTTLAHVKLAASGASEARENIIQRLAQVSIL